MKRKAFRVTVDIPDDATITEMREYIKDAVQTWKGQLHPSNPISELNYKNVSVVPIKGGYFR